MRIREPAVTGAEGRGAAYGVSRIEEPAHVDRGGHGEQMEMGVRDAVAPSDRACGPVLEPHDLPERSQPLAQPAEQVFEPHDFIREQVYHAPDMAAGGDQQVEQADLSEGGKDYERIVGVKQPASLPVQLREPGRASRKLVAEVAGHGIRLRLRGAVATALGVRGMGRMAHGRYGF